MSKYKKEVIVIAVLFAVMIIIAASAGLTAGKIGTNAYALDPIEIITQPKGITGVYGEGKYKLEIKLSENGKSEMLPFTKEYVPTINIKDGYIIVRSLINFAEEDEEEISFEDEDNEG